MSNHRVYLPGRWKFSDWPLLKEDGPYGQKKLVTIKEFARQKFVIEETVRRWIIVGKVKGIKRRKWYVYPDSFRPF